MTTQEKLIHRKQSLLELAEYLTNVSAACRVMGVSRQHFYDIKQAYEDGGVEALREKSRRTLIRRYPPKGPSMKHLISSLLAWATYDSRRASFHLHRGDY